MNTALVTQWLEEMGQPERDLVVVDLAMENGRRASAGMAAYAIIGDYGADVVTKYAAENAGKDGLPALPNGNVSAPASQQPPATTPAPQPPEEQQPTLAPTAGHVKKQWLFFSIIVLVVLLVGSLGAFFIYNEMTTSQEVVYFTYSSSAPLGVGDVVQVVQPCGDLQQLVVYHLSAMDIAAGQFEVPPVKEGCETRYVVTLEVTP